MIAEGTVVGMFLNGHNLNAVIAVLDNAGQHILTELTIAAHLLGILPHADVAFVDEQRCALGLEGSLLPDVWSLGIPHLCGEYLGLLVLHHAARPSRYALALATVPAHAHLVEVTVFKGFFGEFQLPVSGAFDTVGAIAVVLFPVVEVAHQIEVGGIGCPLAEHPPP